MTADILITSTSSLAGWGYIVLLAGMALGVLLMVGVWWVLHCPRSPDDLRAEWQALTTTQRMADHAWATRQRLHDAAAATRREHGG